MDHGHGLGLEVGWYQNGCKCPSPRDLPLNYEGDIKSLHDFGFDAVKMDDCGMQKNMTRYAEIMLASGRNYSIENHKHPEAKECGPEGGMTGAGSSACPSLDWCPFNWYRASHDINTKADSWFGNLQVACRYCCLAPPAPAAPPVLAALAAPAALSAAPPAPPAPAAHAAAPPIYHPLSFSLRCAPPLSHLPGICRTRFHSPATRRSPGLAAGATPTCWRLDAWRRLAVQPPS